MLDLRLGSRAAEYVLAVATSLPEAELVYFGTETGEFLQAGILESGVYVKHIDGEGDNRQTVIEHYGPLLKPTGREILTDDRYDPRVRPWYIGAKRSGKTFWTEPYVFHENGQPGITVACPVRSPGGSLKGVVAADITMRGLCRFLRGRQVGARGEILVLDSRGTVLAYRDEALMTTVENGQARRLRPGELGLPEVSLATEIYEASGARAFAFKAEGERVMAHFAAFSPSPGKTWTIAIVAPESDFLGPIQQTLGMTILLSGSVLALSAFLGFVLAREISRPIEMLTGEVLGVRDLDLEMHHDIRSHIREIRDMNEAVVAMKSGLRAFSLYVPNDLVRELIASGKEIGVGGEDREATLFFSDIEGFSGIAESQSPAELMEQLSEYFDCMNAAIESTGGTVDKFIGDGIMAFWNAPRALPDHPLRACRAALRCLDASRELNARRLAAGKPSFRTRIGIHTGHVVVGNVGAASRLNYSVIGDAVNLASRLEGANKVYGTQLAISSSTYRHVADVLLTRPLDHVIVAGKRDGYTIYEVMAEYGTSRCEQLRSLSELSTSAYHLYLSRRWPEALAMLHDAAADCPNDSVIRLYIDRCNKLLADPPGTEWSGISELDGK
jgi:adenylate cyclase